MKKQTIQLSDHFDYSRLIRFALPPICTMIFTSLYGIVDGYFVSNCVGSTAFASLNLVMPAIMMVGGVGFMFGSGGNALVSFHLGMQQKERANRYFSLIVYAMTAVGLLLGAILFALAAPVSRLLGASENMLPYCVLYLRINMIGIVFFMLQQLFQSFLITAEKPKLGFRITLLAGFTNMFLDWLLVGKLRLGLAGAAWATVASQAVGGMVPLGYFLLGQNAVLRLGAARFEPKVILKACGNGMSEFLSSVSSSLVGLFYNLQLIRYAGEYGVAAYGVIMYVAFIFAAIYIGYTMGISPVIGYHDGAGNRDELRSLFRKSMLLLTAANLGMTLLAEGTAVPLTKLFVGYQPELYALTIRGLRIYSAAFLVMGYNIFASALFTALNNGLISALLSVSRTLVLQMTMIFLLPALLGVPGLWAVAIAVEGIGALLSALCFMRFGKQYGFR